MRCAGTLDTVEHAQRFVDHLLTQGVEAQVREQSDGPAVWITEESELQRARTELERFLSDPDDPRYEAATAAANKLRARVSAEAKRRAQAEVPIASRWQPPELKDVPVTMGLGLVIVVVGALTGLSVSDDNPVARALTFIHPDVHLFPAQFLPRLLGLFRGEVFEQQYWRFWSSMFLHMGILHLVFNLSVLSWLGMLIESRRGSARLLGIVLFTGFVAHATEYLVHPSDPVGFSGVNYGLLGYAWMRAVYFPRLGVHVSRQQVSFLLFWLLLCFIMPINIANWAHAGGLLAGMLLGRLPLSGWRPGSR